MIGRRGLGVAAALAAGCSSAPSRPAAAPSDRTGRDDETRLARQYSELEDDILTSYERDEPSELATGMIDARIGPARIGVGPSDVAIAAAVAHARRWPLEVDHATRTEARSKHLEIHIALDQTAAWMADELSWRIDLCHRSAVVPLRITALYARDGDRWVPVVEHLSFGFAPTPMTAGPPGLAGHDAGQPAAIKPEVASAELRKTLLDVVARGLLRAPRDPTAIAQGDGALVLGPDIADEWHGPHVLDAGLPAGAFDEPRIGLVGRNPATATIAYWVGNYTAGLPARPGVAAGEARMRATLVFEKRWFDTPGGLPSDARSCHVDDRDARDNARLRDLAAHCRWVLAQTHLSQPISDDDLTQQVFGTALISSRPLRLDCSDGSAPGSAPVLETAPEPTAPAAARRPAPAPPAAGTP